MKKYLSPELKTLILDTNDICNSSVDFKEQFDIGLDPHVQDRSDW